MASNGYAEFRTKVEQDPELRERLLAARAEATVKVAADAGFTITTEEARREFPTVTEDLSDDRLEAIAGGLLDMPFALDELPPE